MRNIIVAWKCLLINTEKKMCILHVSWSCFMVMFHGHSCKLYFKHMQASCTNSEWERETDRQIELQITIFLLVILWLKHSSKYLFELLHLAIHTALVADSCTCKSEVLQFGWTLLHMLYVASLKHVHTNLSFTRKLSDSGQGNCFWARKES